MPRFTVVGPLSDEDMVWTITKVYRGHRPQRIPTGGWGHLCAAPNRNIARRRAQATFNAYAEGRLQYEHEFIRSHREPSKWRLPWRRRIDRVEVENVGEIYVI